MERRGFIAAMPELGSIIGFLLGSGVGALVATIVGDQALQDWGWRLPFLLGGGLAACGFFLRRGLSEPPVFAKARRREGPPVMLVLRHHWRDLGVMVALILVNSIGFFMLFVYAVSYLTERMHVSTAEALDINTLSLLAMLPVTYVTALYSDRIGRKPLLVFVALGTLIGAWPLWWLMHHESFWLILTGQLGFAVLFAVGYVVISPMMVELLPADVRCSGVAIGYNICLGIFGGTTPLVATYLVERTADDFAPVWYLMVAAVISLVVITRIPETARKPLPA